MATPQYKIVRVFFDGGKRTIKTGLTLDEAQAHCRNPETSSSTATSSAAKARTRRLGKWMDTYEEVKTPTIYVQRNGNGQRETVDEFKTRSEAFAALKEYRMADPTAEYYLSSRACGGWNN